MTQKTLVSEATPDARYGAVLFEGTRLFGKIDTAEEAERVAACWNVCDGISTEVLKLNATAGGVAHLERQRDELLAALTDLLTPSTEASPQRWHAAKKAGHTLIAEIKRLEIEPPTYHDVVVFVEGQRIGLFNSSYGLQLHCTRSAGWQLWNVWDGKEELLGGEYSNKDFRIEVRGAVICQSKPSEDDEL
jgi:hypothetical protein